MGDAFSVAEPDEKGLGAFEGMDLTLLIDSRHRCFVGRVEIIPTTSCSFSTRRDRKLRVR
jgi:hypothetical protein